MLPVGNLGAGDADAPIPLELPLEAPVRQPGVGRSRSDQNPDAPESPGSSRPGVWEQDIDGQDIDGPDALRGVIVIDLA